MGGLVSYSVFFPSSSSKIYVKPDPINPVKEEWERSRDIFLRYVRIYNATLGYIDHNSGNNTTIDKLIISPPFYNKLKMMNTELLIINYHMKQVKTEEEFWVVYSIARHSLHTIDILLEQILKGNNGNS